LPAILSSAAAWRWLVADPGMVAPFEPTPLEWQMLGDAAKIMWYTGDPAHAQAYFDLAPSCRAMVMRPAPAPE
jgi:hypothetical protein